MSIEPSFGVPGGMQTDEQTGRYVVTFRDEAVTEGMTTLRKQCGISKLPNAADFEESAVAAEQLDTAGGAVFPTLGVAVVSMEDEALTKLMSVQTDESAILDVEPERMFYALGDATLPLADLHGFRDAADLLYQKAAGGMPEETGEEFPTAAFADDAQATWGLKATRTVHSKFSGRGIRVAVLDTGMDLKHPDFRGRSILSRSFITGQDVQDGHGHGTHCIGTACGHKDANGRRYGVAYESTIYAGKVLSNSGSGATSGIIAGMEWAISQGCQVISMSLGNLVTTPSTAYVTVGRRALQNGCLVVAAAGNHGQRPAPANSLGQPANSSTVMAVAALDESLRRASFSAISGSSLGANVDIAGPGVRVYSSVQMPGRYGTFSGTSMATPHVAGLAALWAQAELARGWQLWAILMSYARRLPLSSIDAGAGLSQAPA